MKSKKIEVIVSAHPKFTSNTYLIRSPQSLDVYLVDIGFYPEIAEFIKKYNLRVKALFLTHGHYDHIYFLNMLLQDHPGCEIYGHIFTLKSLLDPKLNLSFYHEDPVTLSERRGTSVEDGWNIELYPNISMLFFHTPGHNEGSLCYKVMDYLFTGDSYIPFVQVVTKLKSGCKVSNRESLQKIKSLIGPNTLIMPGHGLKYYGKEVISHCEIING